MAHGIRMVFTLLFLSMLCSGCVERSTDGPLAFQSRVRLDYRALAAEEKAYVKECTQAKAGTAEAADALVDAKAGAALDSQVIAVLRQCIDIVERKKKVVSEEEAKYVTELVKPALRNPGKWGTARCNDGTPFAFKVEKPLKSSTTWVIFFQGGGFCDDYSLSCKERKVATPELTTTLQGRDGQKSMLLADEGIFNHDNEINPLLSNANKVYAHYCSSDLWSGDTAQKKRSSADSSGWYYSGRINARAMLEALNQEYGLDDEDPGLQILFAGTSAGCMGADINAEQLAGLMPNAAKGGRIKLVSDGCFSPSYKDESNPSGDSESTILGVLWRARDFWSATTITECEQDMLDQEKLPGNCYGGALMHSYLASCSKGLCLENLVQYSSIDRWAVANHNIDPEPGPENTALEEWRRQALADLKAANINWLFSGGDVSYHTLLGKDAMWFYGPEGGPTFGEFVNDFWLNSKPRQIVFGNPNASDNTV